MLIKFSKIKSKTQKIISRNNKNFIVKYKLITCEFDFLNFNKLLIVINGISLSFIKNFLIIINIQHTSKKIKNLMI